jgi:hypothetical protein
MFIASNTVEQMILEAAKKLGSTPASVRHWNMDCPREHL